MIQLNEKAEQPKLLPETKINYTERPILQPPKIVSQPKIRSQAPIMQNPGLPEK